MLFASLYSHFQKLCFLPFRGLKESGFHLVNVQQSLLRVYSLYDDVTMYTLKASSNDNLMLISGETGWLESVWPKGGYSAIHTGYESTLTTFTCYATEFVSYFLMMEQELFWVQQDVS